MKTTSLSFRFSGKIARLLGRESVSNEIVALFELVKNSYDADAETVEITFDNTSKAGGTIRVKDNGNGMTFEDFKNRWMIVGTESKEKDTISRKGRRVVGEKGVGRFSTEKLAKHITLISNPAEKKEKIVVKINWDDYEKDGIIFDQIENPVVIESRDNENDHGLEIILDGLRDKWTEHKIKRLVNEIGTLILPKSLAGPDQDFTATVVAPEYHIEHQSIESSLLNKAPFSMKARLDGQKLVCIINEEKNRHEREPHKFGRLPLCGPLNFQMYFFPQDAGSEYRWTKYYENNLNGLEIQDLLDKYSGIRIYRDGFWVKPYGGKGNDWLELDKRRVSRLSNIGNSRVIGFVRITKDGNPEIMDTTTRERLIENEAFYDMKTIIELAVIEFDHFREEIRKKQKKLEESIPKNEQAINNLDSAKKVVKRLEIPESDKKYLLNSLKNTEKQVKEFTTTKSEESEEKDLALESQRSLVTLGLVSSYVSHEVIKPLYDNMKILNRMMEQKNYPDMKGNLEQIIRNTTKLYHFMSFVNEYVATVSRSIDERWSPSDVAVIDTWKVVEEGFKEIINELDISLNYVIPDTISIFINTVDMESILTNLLTNSIKALKKVKDRKRLIKIHISLEEGNFVIKFADNGPGVNPEDKERIFEPLFTGYKIEDRKTHGTGLGLAIVRDVLKRYDGTIELLSEGEYTPGATFLIKIPLSKTKVAV